MRTSRRLLRQVRRAILIAFAFSCCINVLALAAPLYILQIFETVVPTGSLPTLAVLTGIVALAVAAIVVIEICRDRILLRAGLWLDHVLGRHVLENGLKWHAAAAELKGDAQALAAYRMHVAQAGINVMFDLPWLPAYLAILLLLHPLIGAVAALAALILFMAAMLLATITARAERESQQAAARAQAWHETVADRASTVGALGLTRGAAEQWEEFHKAHVAYAYTAMKRASAVRSLARALRLAAQLSLYAIGAWLIVRGELAPGALVASAVLMARALQPLEQLVTGLKSVQAAFEGYRRLSALPPDAADPAVHGAAERVRGHLVLSEVTYYHPSRKVPALRGVSLELQPGHSMAIVGANGAGKSTLARIIAGGLAPTSGAADLDGVPVVSWQRSEATAPIGYLPDEPLLLAGTVHDNIARFTEASKLSVARSAMRAGVHETITALPGGYGTDVGTGGCSLALRERRAVALAAAVHGDPRIVVLDEPELGLDGASLRQLMRMLEALKADGVSLVIATQDPRLLTLADTIVVIDQGTIQSIGPASDVRARLHTVPTPSAAPSEAAAQRGAR